MDESLTTAGTPDVKTIATLKQQYDFPFETEHNCQDDDEPGDFLKQALEKGLNQSDVKPSKSSFKQSELIEQLQWELSMVKKQLSTAESENVTLQAELAKEKQDNQEAIKKCNAKN